MLDSENTFPTGGSLDMLRLASKRHETRPKQVHHRFSRRRALRFTGAYALVFVMTFASSAAVDLSNARPAFASFYFNRTGVTDWADNWWQYRNPAFPHYNNDCANFVSQVWYQGGGIPQDLQWFADPYVTSPAWNNVVNFINYLAGTGINHRTLNNTKFAQLYNVLPDRVYTTARPADAVVYNWNDGGPVYDHLAVIMATEYLTTYYDVRYNYTWTFNKYMDTIDQHTTDRYHAPWNLGYLERYYLDTDPGHASIASGMIFQAVIVNN